MKKETKKAPTIRFRGFNDDWEQRKLEDFGRATGGTSIESEFNKEGKYKVISIGSYSENSTYTDQGIRCNLTEKTQNRILNKNDLTMILNDKTAVGRIIGRVLLIEQDNSYVYNQRTERIEPNKNKYDPLFLYEMLNAPGIRSKIVRQCQGNTQIYVNWPVIANQKYKIPELKEQKIIGFFLKDLDHLITLHQRKLNQLKTLKKYFLQNMFPAKGEKVPRIRFKGFTGDWEQRKLGDVFTSLQNNTLSRADLSDEGGLALNIHYGDILIKYGEFLDVSKERIPYLTNKKTIDKFKKSHLQNGDIVVSDTAEDETVGKCTEINGVKTQIVLSGLHTIPLRPVQRFAKGYFGSYLNSEAYHAQLKPLMQGIKVTSISKRAIQDTTVIYPLDLMEQEKIGQYFLSLDHLITLHQRKLEQLQTMKKFMLQNMFI